MQYTDPLSIAMMEATITHGKVVSTGDLDAYPPRIKRRILDIAAANGIDEKNVRRAISQVTGDEYALHGDDMFDGIFMHTIEKYNKEQDEAILASENLVEAYNSMIDGRFNAAVTKAKEFMMKVQQDTAAYMNGDLSVQSEYGDMGLDDQDIYLMIDNLVKAGTAAKNLGLNDDEIKEIIVNAYYRPTDDPEKIREIVNARIQYNNAIISMFRTMIKENYKLLGITAEEAEVLMMKLESKDAKDRATSVSSIKEAIVKNQDKFMVRPGVYDFRPIGAGCIFITTEEMGSVGPTVTNDRMIQLLMQYDAIVVGHGNNYNRKQKAYVERMMKEIKDKVAAHNTKMRQLDEERRKMHRATYERISKVSSRKARSVMNKYQRIVKQREKVIDSYSQRLEEIRKKADAARDELDKYEYYSADYDQAYERYDLYIKYYMMMLDKRSEMRDEFWEFEKKMDALKWSERDAVYDAAYKELTAEGEAKIKQMDMVIDEYQRKSNEDIRSTIDDFQKRSDRLNRKYSKDNKWTIQPVSTLNGGPYTEVDEVMRQLIREGFKKIYLVACNPGRMELARDIRTKPGITIHHATRSLLAENVTNMTESEFREFELESYINPIETNLSDTETHLMEMCNRFGIRYTDNKALDECVTEYLKESSFMNEGVLKNIWISLVKIIKSALGFIVKIFKAIINFVKNVVNAIKDFFKKIFGRHKGTKLSNSVRSSVIMVENASMTITDSNSLNDIQIAVLNACGKLSNKIKEVEHRQTENMDELRQYSEDQVKNISEASNPKFDSLCSMMFS